MLPNPTTEQWTTERIEIWKELRHYIKSHLGHKYPDSIDDVHQEIFIWASKSLNNYDPARGDFKGWMYGITKRQIANFLKKENRDRLLEEQALKDSQVSNSYMHTTSRGHDEEIILQLDTVERISRVLKVVEGIFDENLYRRSILLIREFDGKYSLAAKRLGVSTAALRDSHRQLIDLAQIVDRALEGHHRRKVERRMEEEVTIREILACFPDPESDDFERSWMKAVPLAVMSAGAFTVDRSKLIERVSHLTGYAPVTARHVVSRCERLCMVARAVLESGSSLYEEPEA